MVVTFDFSHGEKSKHNDNSSHNSNPIKRQKISGEELSSCSLVSLSHLSETGTETPEESRTTIEEDSHETASTNQNDISKHMEVSGTTMNNGETAATAENSQDMEGVDQEWDEFVSRCQEGPQDDTCWGVNQFLQGKTRRENAKQNLSSSLEQCNARLQNYVETIVQDIVVPIHSQERDRLDTLEAAIKERFVENHVRRTQFQKELEKSKQLTDSITALLMARTMNRQDPSPIAQEVDEITDDTSATDENGEPNWELLAQYERSKESIQLFNDGCERLRCAEVRFADAVERIHASLKENAEAMVSIAVEMFQNQEEILDELEADIQSNMMSNFKRRMDFKRMLEESVKQTQCVYSNLFNLVNL